MRLAVVCLCVALAGCAPDSSRLYREAKTFCEDRATREYLAGRAGCDSVVPVGASQELRDADAKVKRLCSGVRRVCDAVL